MSAKGPRLEQLIEGCGGTPYDPRYVGWFRCFNDARYYDAHDVLESLWAERGAADPEHGFFKGLIQLAGGFVHLRLHREQPTHRIHGGRLGPAARLFALAIGNLEGYLPRHAGMDVEAACGLAARYLTLLAVGGPGGENPWSHAALPRLDFPQGSEGCPAAAPA